MDETNPYEPPQTRSIGAIRSQSAGPKPQRRLLYLVVPTFVGAVIGSIFLASYVRGPGDPSGHSIGAGLGGFIGLAIGFFARISLPRG